MTARFLRARFLLPMDDGIGRDTRISDGYVLWSGDELIEVGAFDGLVAERLTATWGERLEVVTSEGATFFTTDLCARFPCHDGVLLPAFVKAHGHDHEPPIIGLCRDLPLTAWLDGVVNPFTTFMKEQRDVLADRLGRSPQSVAYRKARLDDIWYGITSAMTHHCNASKYYVDDLVASAEEAGTRLIAAIGSQDRFYAAHLLDTPDEALARLDAAWEKHGAKPRIRIVPGPDQLFSNGPEMLVAQKRWGREHDTLLHCHSSEEARTTAWFCDTFGMTPVAYAAELDILDDDTVLAHQVHSTPADLDILAATGTCIVHNPLANTILGSGMPPVVEMIDRGIPLAVSTDGSGSADNQNILAAARLASQYQKARLQDARVLSAQQALELITVEPAKLLRIDAGVLAPGKAADIVLVDLSRPNLVPTRTINLVENLIWATDGSEVRLVIGGGEVLRDGERYLTLDRAEILADVQILSEAYDAWKADAPLMSGTGANQ